jgi:hypothetical protein
MQPVQRELQMLLHQILLQILPQTTTMMRSLFLKTTACLQGLLEQAQMVQEWELQAVVQQVQVLQSVLDQAEIAQHWASSAVEAVLQMVQEGEGR